MSQSVYTCCDLVLDEHAAARIELSAGSVLALERWRRLTGYAFMYGFAFCRFIVGIPVSPLRRVLTAPSGDCWQKEERSAATDAILGKERRTDLVH